MKNMKKLISALTALSFVTVAGVSVVACGQTDTTTKAEMNSKVLEALGLADSEGASIVTASINNNKWDVTALADINASALLTNEGQAKNDESKNFLTSILKLTETDGHFDAVKAASIKLTVTEIKPVLTKITNDFAIEKGTVTVEWKGTSDQTLGTAYTINLKGDANKGVVADQLPNLTLDHFKIEGVLSEFHIGGKTEQLQSCELQSLLLTDDATVKGLSDLNTLVNQGELKVTITDISTKDEEFASGDTLTLKVNFGDLQFKTEFTLTVLESKALN